MNSIKSLFAFLLLLVAVPLSLLAEGQVSEKVLELAPMVVTTSPGDIGIYIVREKGLSGRYGSIRAIIVSDVKEGSIYAKMGINPGAELVSIQGMRFAGSDYTKEKVIEMLTSTEVTSPYFEFEICKTVGLKVIRGGSAQVTRVVRNGPVQVVRVPVLRKIGTTIASNQ